MLTEKLDKVKQGATEDQIYALQLASEKGASSWLNDYKYTPANSLHSAQLIFLFHYVTIYLPYVFKSSNYSKETLLEH